MPSAGKYVACEKGAKICSVWKAWENMYRVESARKWFDSLNYAPCETVVHFSFCSVRDERKTYCISPSWKRRERLSVKEIWSLSRHKTRLTGKKSLSKKTIKIGSCGVTTPTKVTKAHSFQIDQWRQSVKTRMHSHIVFPSVASILVLDKFSELIF